MLGGNKLSAAWPPVENLEEIPEKILGVPVFSSTSLNYGYELVIYTGFFYYMYNEMAYLVLGEVTATAQAAANTVKRAVILLATVAFLGRVHGRAQGLGRGRRHRRDDDVFDCQDQEVSVSAGYSCRANGGSS